MAAMNISFRTLKGDKFKLDATPEETVTDLKKKVVARYDDKEFNAYRLIYKGKVLDNAKTLAESGVTEAGFIVVMPPKRAAPPKPAAAPATKPAEKPAPSQPKQEASKPAAASTAAAAPAAAPASSAAAGGSSSSLVTGAEYEATVKRICEMGFPETEVKRALRAAFNNPDRAVDYLFNGIPASAAPPAPPSTPPQGAPTTTQGGAQAPAAAAPRAPAPGQPFDMFGGNAGGQGGAGGPGGAGGAAGNLEFLRRRAPFNNMRRMIQSNPAVLQQILQQLEQSDPALLQLINNNREEFMNLINQPDGGEGGQMDDAAMEQLASQLGGTGVNAQGQLLVTEEENQVITRLTELGATMGLEQMHVIQAWLACDKDENLAANYLLNNSEELRAQQAEDAAYAEAEARNRGQGGGGGGGQPPPPTGGS